MISVCDSVHPVQRFGTLILFFIFLGCVLYLHDNFFARGLQHHVLGPVVPVLVGLGLVHDLLEHGPLPVRRQRGKEKVFFESLRAGSVDALRLIGLWADLK